jgi:hypothetical protein
MQSGQTCNQTYFEVVCKYNDYPTMTGTMPSLWIPFGSPLAPRRRIKLS